MRKYHQKIPNAGPEREALRRKGQFWTPNWVAEAMVGYVLSGGSHYIFDPAVGEGAFFRAAKTVASETYRTVSLLGAEIDPDALQQARKHGLSENDLSCVQVGDFLLEPTFRRYKAIVANPPYIRHHRLSNEVKANLKKMSKDIIGTSIDGRAGLHIYFLLHALQLLTSGGRLAFIVPADTCEGVFASELWNWITTKYRLDAVITFTSEASPFPGVDTNPLVLLIRNEEPKSHFFWTRCSKPYTNHLKDWTLSEFKVVGNSISVLQRSIEEGLATGLSRAPIKDRSTNITLGHFAKVMRGIATGANKFFFLTRKQAYDLGLPGEFLLPAIGRTRDITSNEVTTETMKALDELGRPTLLFSPNGQSLESFPDAMRDYLKYGESLELHKRILIATRQPWYKMETRPVPPILFSYLGRRNSRFIRNFAGVVPLTGFLCIYPLNEDPIYINKLWRILQHPKTISNLSLVGKSYGAGAIKVEPRALEKLPIPLEIVLEIGITFQRSDSPKKNRPIQSMLSGWDELPSA